MTPLVTVRKGLPSDTPHVADATISEAGPAEVTLAGEASIDASARAGEPKAISNIPADVAAAIPIWIRILVCILMTFPMLTYLSSTSQIAQLTLLAAAGAVTTVVPRRSSGRDRGPARTRR